jgi:hypothetical protein
MVEKLSLFDSFDSCENNENIFLYDKKNHRGDAPPDGDARTENVRKVAFGLFGAAPSATITGASTRRSSGGYATPASRAFYQFAKMQKSTRFVGKVGRVSAPRRRRICRACHQRKVAGSAPAPPRRGQLPLPRGAPPSAPIEGGSDGPPAQAPPPALPGGIAPPAARPASLPGFTRRNRAACRPASLLPRSARPRGRSAAGSNSACRRRADR